MTQQGPDGGNGNTADHEAMSDQVQQLTTQLRASIQSFTQGELRRQERLTQFDQHLMQMETSIRDEVTRLRSTGSVVELVAGEVRRAVDGLIRLGFDPTHEQLSELQQQVAAIPQPDLTPIHDQLTSVQADLRALPVPDDTQVRAAIGAVTAHLRDLGAAMDQLAPRGALQSIAADIAGLATKIDGLPAPDDAALLLGIDRLTAEIDGLRTSTADRFDALPTADQLAASLEPTLSSVHEAADPAPVLVAVEQAANRLSDQLASLAAATAAIRAQVAAAPDHVERLETLDAHTAEIRREVALLADATAEITRQTAPISSVASELSATAATIAALEARIEVGTAVSREAADSQRLALARVVASADGLSASLGAVRASVGAAAEAAGAATIAAINEAIDDRLQATEARMTRALDALAAQLRSLTEQIERAPVRETTTTPTMAVAEETAPVEGPDS